MNDAGGSPSRIVLRDATEGQRSDADDVTRGTVDGGPVEQDNDKETPSNPPDREDFVHNVPSLSTERQRDLQEHDNRFAVVELRTEQPLVAPSDHVGDDVPDPARSDRSERECQWPGNTLNLSLLIFSSRGEILNGRSHREACHPN